ncbi:NAD-dependent epimerase/dehydratase family protein [Gammaproteobacteria bacterium]|nr:NAD-dependent epimerase/dehydratase family protein [Gammaproteobacteria bacterium]
MKKRIIVTGSAGFIGFHTSKKLLSKGHSILGIDNHNDYYNTDLKRARSDQLELENNYDHFEIDITNKDQLQKCFKTFNPDIVVHLAAQAGVQYSIENPLAYIHSNIYGFHNILEISKEIKVEHLIFASSSSVYGANSLRPFSESEPTDHQISLYASTKKSNESMAHVYSSLYGLPSTGLRFFTVFGPWGRPDMAPMKFIDAILNNKEIFVHNDGKHKRDFTYIDDIVNGIMRVIKSDPTLCNNSSSINSSNDAPWQIYNLGAGRSVDLMEFIETLESILGKKAKKVFLPIQPGDVEETFADMSAFENKFGSMSKTPLKEGLDNLIKWYTSFHF